MSTTRGLGRLNAHALVSGQWWSGSALCLDRSRLCLELSTSSLTGLSSLIASSSPSRSSLMACSATAASDRHGHDLENTLACSLAAGDRRPIPTSPLWTSSSVSCCWCCNNCQNSASSSWIPRIVRPAGGPALLVREMTALPYTAAAPPPRSVDTLCSDDVVERGSDDVDDQKAELSEADGATVRCPTSSDGRRVVPSGWVNDRRGDLARLQRVAVVALVVVGMLSWLVTLLLLRRLRLMLASLLTDEFCVCLTASLYLTCASCRRPSHATCQPHDITRSLAITRRTSYCCYDRLRSSRTFCGMCS